MKKSKLILAAAALVLTVAFAGCGKSSGDPNPNGQTNTVPDGYIPIRTAAELDAVRDSLSGNYILMNDISLADYNTVAGWMPIGTDTAPFTGKFDGNGYKITGLTVNIDATVFRVYVGLFGYINGGSVSNLGVEIAAGGMTVSGTKDSYDDFAGGIAGYAAQCMITNCYSTGDISFILPTGYGDDTNMTSGGIVGDANNCTIADCYSTGDIHVNSSYSWSGGITGYAGNSTIANCYSTGKISSDANGNFGGIAGSDIASTIFNCYSTGEIGASSTTGYGDQAEVYAGGIVGEFGDNYYIYSPTEAYSISNCYSTGNISAHTSGVWAWSYAGGIVGGVAINTQQTVVPVTITGCAAINQNIAVSSNTGDAQACGRVVGALKGVAPNNFALSTMATTGGVPFSTIAVSNGTDKQAGDFKNQATYSGAVNGDGNGGLGWAFGSDDAHPWKMGTSGYPVLYWQK